MTEQTITLFRRDGYYTYDVCGGKLLNERASTSEEIGEARLKAAAEAARKKEIEDAMAASR